MGAFEKYIGYRWASSGPGGPNGDGGASGGLVLILAIIVGFMLVGAAIAYIIGGIVSVIYAAGRLILSPAPLVLVPLAGIGSAYLLAHLPPYSPKTASGILNVDEQGNSFKFYAKTFIAVLAIVGLVYLAATEVLDRENTHPLIYIVVLYAGFKMLQLPYRYSRLLRYAPRGPRIVLLCFAPSLTLLILDTFDLSDQFWGPTPLSALPDILSGLFILIPYIIPLIAIKLYAEPQIRSREMQDQTTQPSDTPKGTE